MVRFKVPDSSSSDEDCDYRDPPEEGNDDSETPSSELSDLSRSPTPPPEIHIPVAPTGHRVRLKPVTEADDNDKEILRGVVRHENIVDFWHVEADDEEAAEDGPEDVAYDPAKYPDYIPHYTDIRTLAEIIKESRKPPGLPTSKHPAGLIEPLVWHVMLSILRALRYLHTGQDAHSTKDDPPPGWMPIVHNLIRPGNIILEHPMSKHSKYGPFRYGACKLGNFTRCLVLPTVGEIESADPKDLTDEAKGAIAERHDTFGTLFYKGEETGYEAPEIFAEDTQETQYPGQWSDLWSLGALAVEMMTCRNVWDLILEIEFKDKAQANYHHGLLWERWRHVLMEDRHELLRKFAGEARIFKCLPRLYSRDLRILVEALLSHNPRNRGRAQDVLQDIEQRHETWWRNGGHRIWERSAMDDMLEEAADREELHLIRDTKEYLRRFEERETARR